MGLNPQRNNLISGDFEVLGHQDNFLRMENLFNGTLRELIYFQKVSSFIILSPSLTSGTRLVICIAKHSFQLERRGREPLTGRVTFPTVFQNSGVISGFDQPFSSPKLQHFRLFCSLSVLRLTIFSGLKGHRISQIAVEKRVLLAYCLFWPVSVDLQVKMPRKQTNSANIPPPLLYRHCILFLIKNPNKTGRRFFIY